MAAKKKSAKKAMAKSAQKNTKMATPSAKKSAKSAAPRKSAKKSAPRKSAKKAARPSVLHWEIQARDAARLHGFYSDLFGWKIDAGNPMKYGLVASKGKEGINGGIGGTPPGGSGRVVVYANVADINATLDRAEQLGAKTILPRTDIGMVVMGIFEDVEGNHFGVIED